jgi:hypothetical protein
VRLGEVERGKRAVPGAAQIAMDERRVMYYFGCIESAGHYLWDQFMNSPSMGDGVGKEMWEAFPRLDGGHCPGSRVRGRRAERSRIQTEGLVRVTYSSKKHWTLISFWDRSVDGRGGCNSGFMMRGRHDFLTMWRTAQRLFPHVCSRYEFDVRYFESEMI